VTNIEAPMNVVLVGYGGIAAFHARALQHWMGCGSGPVSPGW
jgi:predicted dehydrogenase